MLAKISELQRRLSLSEWMKHNGIMHSHQLNSVENFAHSNGHLITSGALWDSEITHDREEVQAVCGKDTRTMTPSQTYS